MTKALIDADVIRYAVGYVAAGEPVANCLHSVKMMIGDIVKNAGCDEYVCFLTGQGNFRDDIATIRPYKGNRTQPKPDHYDAITNYIMEHQNGEMVCGMEADDAMGITQFADYHIGSEGSTVIATIDKDLDQIPGWHYNWKRNSLYSVTMDEADKFFYTQLLTGDTVDNIQGVPGLGKVGAAKIIAACTTEEDMYWAAVCEYSKKYDKPMEALIENARLLWILRYPGQSWESFY